jgi:pyruvate/2-oxoglutarate dehydrogenase complex dihydrolipoamide dehydrogenase (E3) component
MEADVENQTAEVLVLGGGPGGYTAAFRAADLGQRVVLVDREEALAAEAFEGTITDLYLPRR